jgi:hypothetical protein
MVGPMQWAAHRAAFATRQLAAGAPWAPARIKGGVHQWNEALISRSEHPDHHVRGDHGVLDSDLGSPPLWHRGRA